MSSWCVAGISAGWAALGSRLLLGGCGGHRPPPQGLWRHAEEASSALGVQIGAVEVQEPRCPQPAFRKWWREGGTGGGRGPASRHPSMPRAGWRGAGFMVSCSVLCCPQKEEC